MTGWTRDEMMIVAAARRLWDGCVCFVGIGLPSAACNLARMTHAPSIVLIYESGTIGTRPDILPLSIGDGELAETAACVVPLPEVFSYYLQAGRIDVGFLGAAQIDRLGNLNSTVIGPYATPRTRLPGAGGAPEIATHAQQTFVVMKASPRSFVNKLDFCTSVPHPRAVITDFGVLTPGQESGELMLTELFPDSSVEEARAAVGWSLAIAGDIQILPEPSAIELETLRALNRRTTEAHRRPVELPA
ncbi:MAG TPA: CoA-transferase [Sphingomicrobium sp.]|nr:CoA-transferase [Sphingomicrobium sp.]